MHKSRHVQITNYITPQPHVLRAFISTRRSDTCTANLPYDDGRKKAASSRLPGMSKSYEYRRRSLIPESFTTRPTGASIK